MAIEKEKFFKIIRNVSEIEGLNKDNLLERIEIELKGVNPEAYSTYNNLKINKLFMIQDSGKIVNYMLVHLAVECNSVPIVKLLLAKEAKVNEPIYELDGAKSQLTALHIAALHGHQEIVQLLFNNNANPSLKDSQGRTPMDIVGDVEGKKAIIKMLEEGEQRYVEARATRRQTYRQGTLLQPNNKTPGNLAVGRNNVAAAAQEWNAIGQEENNGTTPNNRKIYVQDDDEQTSSNSITNENNINKVDDTLERERALRERNAVEQKLQEAEQRFANNQKRIEQDYLHNQHLEHYTKYNGERTFLNKSSSEYSGMCLNGDESEALGQSILENGEDIDAQDENGLTFLHSAATNNNEELVKLLVKCRAKIDVQDKDGCTPLHYAAAYGCVKIAEYLVVNEANFNAQDKSGYTPLCYALANDKKESANLLMKYAADRSLIKDEGLIDRLNGMCGQLPEAVPSTSSHSKINNITEAQEEAEKVKKRKVKSKELRAQLKNEQEENESLKQKIQDIESEKATLKDKLDKTKSQHSNHVAKHETQLKEFNKENESLKQEIKNLENENTILKGEPGKTKTKTNEVSLEKAGKRQMSFLKVASVNLVTMLTVGATLSIAFDLSVLPIIVVFVTSAALLASCVTYAISKPIAEPKPTTELKEVDIQGSAQRCL